MRNLAKRKTPKNHTRKTVMESHDPLCHEEVQTLYCLNSVPPDFCFFSAIERCFENEKVENFQSNPEDDV